jgi:RND family efflux transporter MFP subunit
VVLEAITMGAGSSPRTLRVVSVALRVLVGLAMVGIAGAIFGALYSTRPTPAERQEEAAPLAVRVITVRPVEVTRVWEGYGTARAMAQAEVAAQVSARVIERPAGVEPGATVARGDVLIRLDATDFESALASATQMVATLRSDLDAWEIERLRLTERVELAETDAGIEQRAYERMAAATGVGNDYETDQRLAAANRARREANLLRETLELMMPRKARAEAQLAAAEADLRLAEENLARTTVRSPIDGILQRVDAHEGDFLMLGTPVARVIDLRRIEAPLRVPASAVQTISPGDRVELGTDTPGAARAWMGVVARIAPEADEGTRTATVFVEVVQAIGDEARLLLPGQFVVGRVWAGLPEERIVVPRSAVLGDRVMVAAEDEGGARRVQGRQVEVAYHVEGVFDAVDAGERQWAVIASGLASGDQVVVSNLDELRDGAEVLIGSAEAALGTGSGR